jgi:RND superfamily putative drug exporter
VDPDLPLCHLLGLSLDYEVFLVTRMREAWDTGRGNGKSVVFGIERTAGLIGGAETPAS